MTDELQNVMLQHANVNTFFRHYSVGIHVDAQAVVRGLPQKRLMRFASSMSRSIDPRRPYYLTYEDHDVINGLPCVRKLQHRVKKRKQALNSCYLSKHEEATIKYQNALRDVRNAKQIQRRRRCERTWNVTRIYSL